MSKTVFPTPIEFPRASLVQHMVTRDLYKIVSIPTDCFLRVGEEWRAAYAYQKWNASETRATGPVFVQDQPTFEGKFVALSV